MNLEEMRDIKEAEAAQQRADIRRWLELAQIAVPTVLEAAAHGNVRCLAAARRMARLLPESFFARPGADGQKPQPISAAEDGAVHVGVAADQAGAPACAVSPPGGNFQGGGR